ncbi:MAG: hypothetical protein Q8R10_05640 [Pseudomonas sp.]|uniref:ABC-three component system middle component 1 n=1 Tax=Pseudomonas sp. TaxID=306 RepID=UPI0027334AC6|nr:ABC-three component system middle component 1 [Pseudomonas sp.]MDP3845891.1 hypothetical protein [Pseudomonas sp.]
MIKQIIIQAAQQHDFELIHASSANLENSESMGEAISSLNEPPTYMLQHSGESKRFLTIIECSQLISPQQLNSIALQFAPDTFKSDPAFDKNTDLIILHRLKLRADFTKIENSIFAIEENPYYFKKYFLYYSDQELLLLDKHNFDSISRIVMDEREFSEYRDAPLEPTLYSIAARIYIKLPFIRIPIKESALKPLSVYVEEVVSELKLEKLFNTLTDFELQPLEKIAEILINEEMENLQA